MVIRYFKHKEALIVIQEAKEDELAKKDAKLKQADQKV